MRFKIAIYIRVQPVPPILFVVAPWILFPGHKSRLPECWIGVGIEALATLDTEVSFSQLINIDFVMGIWDKFHRIDFSYHTAHLHGVVAYRVCGAQHSDHFNFAPWVRL